MSDEFTSVDEQKVISATKPTAAGNTELEQQKAARDFQKGNKEQTVKLRVHSPFRDYYEGFVFSVTAENTTGPFDILPGHHNFISLLIPCELIIRTADTGEMRIRISGGIIHVKADQVVIFLDV